MSLLATHKRSSLEYVNFRKKITDKKKIQAIKALADLWLLTPQEVCERLLFDGLCEAQKLVKT